MSRLVRKKLLKTSRGEESLEELKARDGDCLHSSEIRGMVFGAVPKDFLTGDLTSAELLMLKAITNDTRKRGNLSTRGSSSSSSSSSMMGVKTILPAAATTAAVTKLRSNKPYVTRLQGPILITAPHGIKLFRGQSHPDEKIRIHKAERWTTEIALRLSEEMKRLLGFYASSMVWHPKLIQEPPDPNNLDPNYLRWSEFELCPWNKMLQDWCSTYPGTPLLHLDVHGKRDRKTNWDLDVGMAAMFRHWSNKEFPLRLQRVLCDELEMALEGTKYTVNRDPELSGYWGGDCHTLAHQSVLLATPAVQLEIPRSLRYDLVTNAALFTRFATAIANTYVIVLAGIR